MSADVVHERVAGDGVRLHVARTGTGPPVVLLHGFPENWRCWRRQMRALADAGFTALAVDLRGYNDSERPRPQRAYHLRHLVADVAAVIRHGGHERAHVIGHDWGGIVAWTFAGRHPELLDRLIILNAPHLRIFRERLVRSTQALRSWYVLLFRLPWIPERVLAANDFAAIRRIFSSRSLRHAYTPEDVEQYVHALAQPGALTAALNYYRANSGPGAVRLASAARTEAHTLVLWGERDRALDASLLEGLERVAPRVRVQRLPRAGHWLHNQAADEVNVALLDFLTAQD